MRIVCVIPARMGSSRFPGKPLELIGDNPMIYHVANRVKSNYVHQIIVATEDEVIYKEMSKHGIDCIITQKHPTCTDRVSEVARELDCDFVVNLQGDEPLMEPETIHKFIRESLIKFESEDVYVTNAVTVLKLDELKDPNRVKAIVEKDIVTNLSRTELSSWKQLGLYMYRTEAIAEFNFLPTKDPCALDTLRFTENFIDVHAIPVETNSLSVDTPQDLDRVRDLSKNLSFFE